jgi:AcrR family transcriptional regulator
MSRARRHGDQAERERGQVSNPKQQPASLGDLPTLRGAAVGRLLMSRIAAASDDVQRIIESAYRVIQRESDPDFELKMRDIVEEAGISTQSFYKLFGSKDEFILILLETGSKAFENQLIKGLAPLTDPLERITFWVNAVLHEGDSEVAERIRPFIVHIPRLTALRPADIENMRAGILAPLESAIADEAAARGELVDAPLTAELIYCLTFSFVHAHVLTRRPPTPAQQDAIRTASLRALGISGPERRSAAR